jgi:hydroxymethylglutaryl-CoA reductase (NADPH)
MLGFITKTTSGLARTSAQRPIHFIIITALLASIAYLSVVDEYIPEYSNYEGGISFYHPPGSDSYQDWIQIEDVSAYPEALKVSVAPLRFRRSHSDLPEIPNTLAGVTSNERILIVESDKLQDSLREISTVSSNGITWKARHNNRITKYYEYLRAGAFKLKDLIQHAESFDIVLITVAYIAMWYTLIKVFVDMRQIGSKFWLAFSIITSSTFAFLMALVVTTKFLGVKIPLISISEGIPFLVAIIGFKHKVSLAASVSLASSSSLDVQKIVGDAISAHTVSLLRDHFVVIGALISIAAYAPHLVGLTHFCILSTLILTFDLLLVYTFFSAILALKVEINRARRTDDLKAALEEDGISSLVAQNVASRALSKEPASNHFNSNDSSSIVSFKVAMIAGFFALHAFWLGSTWLYNSSEGAPLKLFSYTPNLPKTSAEHIKVGSHGTIATILYPRIYMPSGFLVQLEDFILLLLEKTSQAIKDSLISKCLLFGFAISISSNVYFLNASRYQVSANNILLEKEISRPKVAKKVHVSAPSTKSSNVAEIKSVSYDVSDTSSEELEISGLSKQRPLDECVEVLKDGKVKSLTDNEVSSLVVAGKLPLYALEKQLADNTRAVLVRRKAIAKIANAPTLDTMSLPYKGYDYDRVFGACCENVIGYMPLPVGVAGPLMIDDVPYHIPMATTEGCLVASTMRGCKAINAGGGVETVLTQDGMTRGPCVSFASLKRAGAAKIWLDSVEGQTVIKKAFNSTSRFARLQHIQTAIAGTLLFIRFRTTTGDAMGMNMISKGVEFSLKYMVEECGWEDMEVISVSGNYCTDKKPAAINWIEGRGKSIVAEARIPAEVVRKVLKSEVDALVELNISKNLIGSAMAGSVGGFNAHAANLVTAVFLACGQDPAQNVESSNCITLMNKLKNGDLQVSVSMPSIEVGTIGGGTILEPQGAMLDLLGVRGPHPTQPGENARQLARIVASAVLAAELSLCSALAAGHLVQSHMQHNRKGAAAPAAETPAIANGNDLNRLKEGAVNCIKS